MATNSMKMGTCPKCESKDVHSNMGPGSPWASNYLQLDFMDKMEVVVLVCGNCGYVEHYIAYDQDLEQVRKKWPKVDQ